MRESISIITKYFFLAHIPITLLIDLSPLYPSSPLFALPHKLREFYLTAFNDPLIAGISEPGGWFKSLIFLEGFIQLPICVYVWIQFQRSKEGSTATQLTIFAYSVQVITATWACLWECLSFSSVVITWSQKLCLLGFYLPYLFIPTLMAWQNGYNLLRTALDTQKELVYLRQKPSVTAVVHKTIVITGANSGVGFGIVQQLVSQHHYALAQGDLVLSLILTVRDKAKANSVLTRLQAEIGRYGNALAIGFVYLDLLSIASVKDAAESIVSITKSRKIDAIILNAGMAQFLRIDIWKAAKQFLLHPVEAISAPNYKIQRVGGSSADGLGVTFQANFAGHYYLVKRLTALGALREKSAIIWMSSLEATAVAMKKNDLQAQTHALGYESSKRVMDIYWSSCESDTVIKQYLVHPGYCTTNIVADMVSSLLSPAWTWCFYFARLCGMKYHVATAFNGAFAASTIASHPESYDHGKKWGSAGTWDGQSYVAETDYDAITAEDRSAVQQEIQLLRDKWLLQGFPELD